MKKRGKWVKSKLVKGKLVNYKHLSESRQANLARFHNFTNLQFNVTNITVRLDHSGINIHKDHDPISTVTCTCDIIQATEPEPIAN